MMMAAAVEIRVVSQFGFALFSQDRNDPRNYTKLHKQNQFRFA